MAPISALNGSQDSGLGPQYQMGRFAPRRARLVAHQDLRGGSTTSEMSKEPALSVGLVHTGKVTRTVPETSHPVLQRADALDLTAGLITVALLTLSYTGQSGLARILLTLAFAFFVPGRAIVTNWLQASSWSEVAIPMLFSIALLTLLATITLWAHFWKPMALFQVEAWLSLCGLCLGIVRRNRHRSNTPYPPAGSSLRRNAE